jgi:hypothetical protein
VWYGLTSGQGRPDSQPGSAPCAGQPPPVPPRRAGCNPAATSLRLFSLSCSLGPISESTRAAAVVTSNLEACPRGRARGAFRRNSREKIENRTDESRGGAPSPSQHIRRSAEPIQDDATGGVGFSFGRRHAHTILTPASYVYSGPL